MNQPISVTAMGLRGESAADLMRRLALFGVDPGDSDTVAMEKLATAAFAELEPLADQAMSAAASVLLMQETLLADQIVAVEGAPVTGSAATAGVYVFRASDTSDATQFPGLISQLRLFALATGTLKLKVMDLVGSDFVQDGSDVDVVIPATGDQTIAVSVGYQAGQYVALFIPAGTVSFISAGHDGWWRSAGTTNASTFAKGSVNTGSQVQISFTLRNITITEDRFVSIEEAADQARTQTDQVIDALSEESLVGHPLPLGAGTSTAANRVFVFDDVQAYPGRITALHLEAAGAGTVFVKRFTRSGSVMTQVGSDVALAVPGSGAQTIEEIDIPFNAGEYLGFYVTASTLRYQAGIQTPYYLDGSGNNSSSFVAASPSTGNALQLAFATEAISAIAARVAALEASQSRSVISVQSADKVAALGDSYTASYGSLLGKNWLSLVSMLTDWNVANFAVSGETYQTNLARIRSAALTFGNRSWKDYGVTYAALLSAKNDANFTASLDQYVDDLRATAETVKSFGSIPVICTEWTDSRPDQGLAQIVRAAAEELGALSVDHVPNARLFNDAPAHAPFWWSQHPGTRTGGLMAWPFLDFLENLPRPTQALKIFRKRSGVAVGSLDDLMFSTIFQRAALFREIVIGQQHLTSAKSEYYDALNDTVNATHQIASDEYQLLAAGGSVTFPDYGLIEVVFPARLENMDRVTLTLSDPDVTMYVRDTMATPYEGTTRYQAFAMAADPGAGVGAVYSSTGPGGGLNNYTVVGYWNGMLMTTPLVSNQNSAAGSLTKVSGSGPASIAFTGWTVGFEAAYYSNLGRPEGHWVELSGADGTFTLDQAALRGRMHFDKMSFLLYKSGGFSIEEPAVVWTGMPGKADTPRKSRGRSPRGSELISQPYLVSAGALGAWTGSGSPTITNLASTDGGLPKGATGVVQLTTTAQNVSIAIGYASADDDREIEIVVWARLFPAIYTPLSGSPPVTEDSFDLDRIEIALVSSGVAVRYHEIVGLWWRRIVYRTIVPAGSTGRTIRLATEAARHPMQIAYASAKMVD
jgi:hypothetical protein